MEENFFKNLQNKIEGKGLDELQCIFYETAKDLMNNYVLKIDNLKLELTDIEFYYYEEKYHKDPFSHKNELQKTNGHLYVHPMPTKNRGGIDLTFGDEKFYGGILIRGIKDNERFISGSAKIRWHIVEKFGIKDELNEIQNLFENLKKENKIFLEKKDTSKEKYDILHSNRKGLNKEKNKEFCYALYRFIRFEKRSIFDISCVKTISNLTKICNKFPTDDFSMKKIEKNDALKNNINKFIECHKHLNNER